ncbi:PREDICTED: proteoglycan 4-like [Papilio polytes]|uniref:proteoglycan 4-like n=1 Tax=Papilio polytes TaxID=76194 RepID=UPI0006762612|nr:PREDICTED: proteoglycan 4-like [Papilio polytes]
MHIATLIAFVQLSLATAVSDGIQTLTAAELNLELSGDNSLSPFYESGDDTAVHFMRGSRQADSPLSPDIDVQCTEDFIQVTVEFADVFDGIIYSKGFLNDPRCKYVSLGGSESRYEFRVPLDGCGSRPLCNACGTIDNVLVFQADDFVQGATDLARKISCARTTFEVSAEGAKEEQGHVLKLKPFMVDMLDVVAVEGLGSGVECWMDIQKGVFPNTTPFESSIKIGEYLTILVYLKDQRNQFNLKIHDCWAYDNDNYDSPKTNRIQLTDKQGCPKKKKLIDQWQKSRNTGKSGATLIAYSKVSAFRFPETDQVYLTCNVELCTKNCDSSCDGVIKEISTTIRPQKQCYPGSPDPQCPTVRPQIKCYPGSTDPRCPTPSTPALPNCYPGSTDPRCPKPTTPAPPNCNLGSTDPRCPKPTTPAPPNCYPDSSDPRCPKPTTPAPPNCYPGSRDPRCPQTSSPKPVCYPGSPDPNCPQPSRPTTINPPTYLPPTTPELKCYAGSTDARCPKPTTPAPPNCYPGSTDPRCPKATTPAPPKCYPESADPRCPKPTTTAPPNCYPGSRDPRCPKPTTTAPLNCYPGSIDPRCPKPTTPARPNCYPGSTDPRCPKPTTPAPPNCYPGSSDPRCPKPTTPAPPNCYPGSSDPRCPKPTTSIPPYCYPGSNNPRCPQSSTSKPICYPGSNNPNCPQSSTSTIVLPTTTQNAPNCYPGSNDPRCPQPSSTPSSCYPGSKDPKCPQPFAPSSTNPPSTYLPPFPADNEIKSARTSRLAEKTLDYYDEPLLDIDNFEFTRTKPRTRNTRDVSKVNSDLIEASTGLGVIQIAIGGCTFLAVLSIALAVYLYKNKWSNKHSSQTLRDHPC